MKLTEHFGSDWIMLFNCAAKLYPGDVEGIKNWMTHIGTSRTMALSKLTEYIESLTEIERILLGLDDV